MDLRAGEVIRIWDGTINPPGFKRFLVVCPKLGWLLRINTSALWRPNCLLSATKNPTCLKYDSYLELNGVVEYSLPELKDAECLGDLCNDTIEDLIELLPKVLTFNEEECERMVADLNALFDG